MTIFFHGYFEGCRGRRSHCTREVLEHVFKYLRLLSRSGYKDLWLGSPTLSCCDEALLVLGALGEGGPGLSDS